MVAVGGGDGEKTALRTVAQQLMDGVGGAQRLEGLEAEAVGLILQVDPFDAQLPGQGGQSHQRSRGVAGQGLMKGPDGSEGLLIAAVGQDSAPGVGVDNQF